MKLQAMECKVMKDAAGWWEAGGGSRNPARPRVHPHRGGFMEERAARRALY
jgi:hypothetical protein